jgi:ABC-type lipopolysaccharide export system ATPase subunit
VCVHGAFVQEAQHFADGLAPIIGQRIGELLRQLRSLGATVLIAEQNMHFSLGLATHATMVRQATNRDWLCWHMQFYGSANTRDLHSRRALW